MLSLPLSSTLNRRADHPTARSPARADDKRTALHLAASEGLVDVVRYLIEEAEADASPVDRWGGTPLDARQPVIELGAFASLSRRY